MGCFGASKRRKTDVYWHSAAHRMRAETPRGIPDCFGGGPIEAPVELVFVSHDSMWPRKLATAER
jgi:hypothetical protein